MNNGTPLIEDYLPIEAISAEASREKRQISGLHVWWARRPLVACRAAVFGALVPADWPERNAKLKEQLDTELKTEIETVRKKHGGKVPNRATSAVFVKNLCRYPGSPRTIQTAQRLILTAHADRLTDELTDARKSGKMLVWVEEFKFTGDRITIQNILDGQAPRPRVLDMFAGGGAIPLEALRLGCETYALDLNPVAHIIELCTLVYPQKYGKPDQTARGIIGPKNGKGETTWGGLAEEVAYWCRWVLWKVKVEIGDLYRPIPDPAYKGKRHEIQFDPETGNWVTKITKLAKAEGNTDNLFQWTEDSSLIPGYLVPTAYLWTRTVRCKNPACMATVPLVKQTWLCKKAGKYIALRMVAQQGQKQAGFEVVESASENGLGFDPAGFSKGGNATCPFCGTVANIDYVKDEGWQGRMWQQMLVVVCSQRGVRGKLYISADAIPEYIPDMAAIQERIDALCQHSGLSVPIEPIANLPNDCRDNSLGITVRPYGIRTWGCLFTDRQMICLLSFVNAVRKAETEMKNRGYESNRNVAVTTYLSLVVDKLCDYNSSLCAWHSNNQQIMHTFGRQVLPMVWDFTEVNPFGGSSGSWESMSESTVGVIPACSDVGSFSAIVTRASATGLPWPNESFDAIITDPPYYDNVPYADISDFFYVWLRRTIGHLYPEHFSSELTPKKLEAIADASRHEGSKEKAKKAYEKMMAKSFAEAYRVLKSGGEMVVVYAHKTTLGWATLIDALRTEGFIVTEAWPLDTEMKSRLRGRDSAALASSIFLVSRKRDANAGIGQYEKNVQPELAQIVRERVDTLWDMGITGADLVIAAVGAGLRAFTRYERVEYANGEEVPAEKFLAEVEGVVLDMMMAKLFGITGGNVSAVDPDSRFYVLWRFVYKTAEIDAGEAIVFTYSQHVELDGPKGLSVGKDALVEKKKAKYRVRDFAERGQHEKLGLPPDNGQPAPLIDVLHRILWLIENSPRKLAEFLDEARPERERLRVVAQTLAGAALSGKSDQETERLVSTTPAEQAALGKLLANWRNLIESQLVATEEGLFGKKGR